MTELSDVLLLLLGWLLGMLSPAIVERIQRRYRGSELQAALGVELRELQFTLMATAYRVRAHLGTLDKAFLEWAAPVYRSYRGSSEDAGLVEAYDKLLTLPPEQFAAAASLQKAQPGMGLNLKTHALPFLAAQVGNLAACPLPFHQGILQVKAKVDQFNEHVLYMRGQHDLTFGSLAPENHAVVATNLRRGYEDVAQNAVSIVDLIGRVAGTPKK